MHSKAPFSDIAGVECAKDQGAAHEKLSMIIFMYSGRQFLDPARRIRRRRSVYVLNVYMPKVYVSTPRLMMPMVGSSQSEEIRMIMLSSLTEHLVLIAALTLMLVLARVAYGGQPD